MNKIKKLMRKLNREDRRTADRIILNSGIDNEGIKIHTGMGCTHRVVSADTSGIILQADSTGTQIRVPYAKIKNAVAYFANFRILDRQEAEAFFSFNSLLFGIVSYIFRNSSKIVKVAKSLRLIMKGIKIFLAGGDKSRFELELASKYGSRNVLMSYFWVRRGKAWKEYLKSMNLHGIIDSGAFSAWNAQGRGTDSKLIDIDEYISFIKKHEKYIDSFLTLDVVGDYRQTRVNLEYMESKGLSPIPIYHMNSPISELDYLVSKNKYKVIALGGTKNQSPYAVEAFYREVFSRYPEQPFHSLGCTKISTIYAFDFFSSDSSAWTHCRRSEVILTEKGQVFSPHIPLEERMKRSIEFLNSLGDYEKLKELRDKFARFVQTDMFDLIPAM